MKVYNIELDNEMVVIIIYDELSYSELEKNIENIIDEDTINNMLNDSPISSIYVTSEEEYFNNGKMLKIIS